MRVILLVLGCLLAATAAEATPVYALRAGHACNTCHIEPSGWDNPKRADRQCSLHCSTCHVSPSGGALRTPAGLFFGREQLSTWGFRPAVNSRPERYRPEGHPKRGTYSLEDGFSGWREGEIPVRAIPDRYGDIEAEPLISLGADFRWMTIVPLDESRELASFPMQLDVYGAMRLFENAVIVGSAGFRGRERNVFTRPEATDYLTVRELYAMIDNLPWGIYVRGGRMPISYGWRIPDHTSFTRRGVDFDKPQDRQVVGLEAGLQANKLFAQAIMFTEGTDWPGDDAPPATGTAATLGWRDLGWQLAANFAHTARVQVDETDRWTGGLSFGLNLHPVTYLGQVDGLLDKKASPLLLNDPFEPGLAAMHQLTWQLTRGVALRGQYDWVDRHLRVLDDHEHRVTLGAQLDPFSHVQTELLYRLNYRADDFVGHELLWIVHLWL